MFKTAEKVPALGRNCGKRGGYRRKEGDILSAFPANGGSKPAASFRRHVCGEVLFGFFAALGWFSVITNKAAYDILYRGIEMPNKQEKSCARNLSYYASAYQPTANI